MTITWLGHSCFLLESNGFRVLLDPYHNVRGLPDIETEADAVYCSHDHFDHGYTEKVHLTSGKENPFTVSAVETFHDDQGGTLRGRNTVRRFTAEGLTVVHMGDLGHALSPQQAEAIGPCDVVLVPVGGYYTVDAAGAKAAAEAVGARVIVPMHYRKGGMGFDELTTVEDFVKLFPAEQVRCYPGNVLTVEKDMPHHVAVLTLA